MSIRIFNTLTGRKEKFTPIKKGKIGMYVCGVTVYDECHIGHIRGAYTFDIVRRYFEYRGYRVRYVRNITDIDDKIIEKAQRESNPGETIREKVKEVAERYTRGYYEDMKILGIRDADIEPRATEHIEAMLELIKKLIYRGYAYQRDGSVYFEVRKFRDYGRLSGQSLDEMEAGARIEVDIKKKDPLDFALWKSSKPGEPYWRSPWGRGRPGWHIECSAMSMRYLGEHFDIHGGGRDLVFPHHENEIAQSECATGKPFANYWMHNGLLTINGTKMAKSLGNFVSVKDIVNRFHPEVLKIFFLSSHYRSPVDFSFEKMKEAGRARERFYILFQKIALPKFKGKSSKLKSIRRNVKSQIDAFRKRFEQAMDDDFNTAQALAVLFDLVTYVNKKMAFDKIRPEELAYGKKTLLSLGNVLGLFEEDIEMPGKDELLKSVIEVLIDLRNDARKNRDFKTADSIRERLNKAGILLEDQKDGTTWRVK